MANTVQLLEQYLPFTAETLAGDLSGYGRDGAAFNAVFNAADGGSYVFDGAGDFILAGNYSMGSAWTVHVRFKWNGAAVAALGLFAKYDSASTTDAVVQIYIATTGTPILYVSNAAVAVNWTWAGLTAGVEYDLSIVYSGGQASVYVDNVQLGASQAWTAGTDQTAQVVWGALDASGTWSFAGNIYWGAVYSRALTSADRALLVDGTPEVVPASVLLQRDRIAFWPLDDVAGTSHTIFDHHGGRHLANVGLTIGADWLEGTGAGYATCGFAHVDDLTSGLPFTFAADVYAPSLSATLIPIAAAYDDDATSDRSWALLIDNAGAKVLYSTNGTSQATLATAAAPAAATWNRVLVSWDGSALRVGLHNGTTYSQNVVVTGLWTPYIPFRLMSYHDGTAQRYAAAGVRIRDAHAWARGVSEAERLHLLGGTYAPPRLASRVINVGLIFGQSNGLGHETMSFPSGITRGNIPHPQGVYNGRREDVWVSQRDQLAPTHWRSAFPRDGVDADNNLGIQSGIAAALPADWAIINVSVGATGIDASFNQWQPDDLYYQEAQAHFAKAMAELTALGYTPRLRVMSLNWGESDGNSSQAVADAYQANLTAMIAQLRTDFGNVPVIINNLSQYQATTPYRATIRGANAAIAASVSRVTLLDNDAYPFVLGNDYVHLTNQGNWERGRREGREWIRAAQRGVGRPSLQSIESGV